MAWSGGSSGGGGTHSHPIDDTTALVQDPGDNTKLIRLDAGGNTTGITGVLATAFTTAKTVTFPDATTTVVGTDATQTLTNKTISSGTTIDSSPTITAKFTFSPSATQASINLGSLAGNPSAPVTGDVWYNSSVSGFKMRRAGGTFTFLNVNAEATNAVLTSNGSGGSVTAESTLTYNVSGGTALLELDGSAETIGQHDVKGGTGTLRIQSTSVDGLIGTVSAVNLKLIRGNTTIVTIDGSTIRIPSGTDASRGSAGNAGRMFFNTDDGQINISDGTNWTLPDGTST